MTLILGERTAEREEEAGEGGGREGVTLAQESFLFGPYPSPPQNREVFFFVVFFFFSFPVPV